MSNRGYDLLNGAEHSILAELNNRLSAANGRYVNTAPVETGPAREERRPLTLVPWENERPQRGHDLIP